MINKNMLRNCTVFLVHREQTQLAILIVFGHHPFSTGKKVSFNELM